jgi:hypothetical protein
MINRLPSRLILVIAALSCLLFVALACGDDDDGGSTETPLTLEKYFTGLEALITDFAAEDLQEAYPEAFVNLGQTQAYYDEFTIRMEGALDEIADMDAPSEVKSEHLEFVDALGVFQILVGQLNDAYRSMESQAEFEENPITVEFSPAEQQVTLTCQALQDIADASSIDVDLLCEVSGGEDLAALKQYFSDVEVIFAEADEATSDAEGALSEGTSDATFDEQKEAIEAYLTDIESIFSDTVNQLRALSVPEQAQEPQFDFISAVEDMIESADAFQQNLASIDDAEHLDTRRADFGGELNGAVERADSACSELSRIATEAGIMVELGCE